MSPPATSVECRVSMSYEERPQTVSSSCRYSSGNSVSSSASNFNLGESASSYGNGGEGYGFKSGCSFSGLAQNGSSRPFRSRPRLAKVRRGGFGGRISNSTASPNVDTRSNPFLPRSSSPEKREDDEARVRESPSPSDKFSSLSGQCENAGFGFVFGGNIGFLGKGNDRRETELVGTGGESENVCNVRGASIGGSNQEAQEHAGPAKKSGLDEKQGLNDDEPLAVGSSVSDSSSGIKRLWKKEENIGRVEYDDDGKSAKSDKNFERVEFGDSVKSDTKGFVFGPCFPESTNRKLKHSKSNRNKRVTSPGSKIRAQHNLRANLEETGNRGFVFDSGGANLSSSFFSDRKAPEGIAHQPLNKNFVFSAGKPVACGIPDGKVNFCESADESGNVYGNGKSEGPGFKTHPQVNLSEQMKNLYINKEKGVYADKADLSGKMASSNGNGVFLFRGSKEYNVSTSMPSVPQERMHNSNVDGEASKSVFSEGSNFAYASENIYVFGNSKWTSICSVGKDDFKLPHRLNESNIGAGVGGHGGQTISQFFSSGISSKEIPQFRKDGDALAGASEGASPNPSFSNKCSQDGLEDRNAELKTFSFVANLHDGFNKKGDHGVKSKMHKNTKSSKTRRKAMPKNVAEQTSVEGPSSSQNTSQANLDSTECYSPMDFSPSGAYPTTDEYQQDQYAEPRPSGFEETKPSFSDCPGVCYDRNDGKSAPSLANSREMPFFSSHKSDISSGDTGNGFKSSHQDFDTTRLHFSSDSGNRTEKFMFSASTSHQGQQTSIKRQQKKKYRLKASHVSSGVPTVGSSFGSTPVFDSLKVGNGLISSSKGGDKKKSVVDQEEESFSYTSAAEKSCDKWRMRGNEAYKNGELSKAEGFYTWGINCIPSGENAIGSSLQPLVLCYSNRAATKMALGRVREALQDCLMAVSLDPQFLKGQIRAANCHLLLGELEDAMEKYKKCLPSGGAICLDRQFVLSAYDGLQKAQKMKDDINHAVELLERGTSEAAITTLELIDLGLSVSLYSEKLFELKAEALLVLQRYGEAIQTCQQTLDFANKNFPKSLYSCKRDGPTNPNHMNVTVWRDRIKAKCYFYQGKFDAALELIDKQESNIGDSLGVVVSTIHDLLKHKYAGNEAFQAGKHREAIEHYTSAILRSTESRPFAAVCFGNRAAAYQALGLIADAIADCSLAIALDENYGKAVSRRATLHEMIRDYKQAALDLEKLVSILENRSRERTKGSHSRNEKELRQTITRLSSIEVEAKKEIPLDMYLILGANQSDTESEIKKAYRKAALKHHPDKAAQSLGRGENDDGRLWAEIGDSVCKDSDRLFKMIGEAYAVLSDPEKRSEYDLREELRNNPRESKLGRSASSRRRQSDVYGWWF